MRSNKNQQEKYTVLSLLEERLTTTISAQLKSEFVMLNAEGVRNVILNMAEVKYADSSGLSAILTANRLCRNSGGILVVCCLTQHVEKLVKISHLDTVLNVLPTEEEAIESVFMNEVESEIEEKEEVEEGKSQT